MKKYNPITKKWEDTDEVLIDKYGEKIQKALYAKNSMDKYDPEKYEVVKGTNVKKSWLNNWFKTPKAFEDGYDFGDVTKTILGTGGKVATEFTRGILNIGEGIGDTINYGISWGADKLGAHEFAENLKNETKKDLFNSYLKPNDEIYGKNSITDSKTDNIVNSLGYMYGLYATAGLGSTTASQTAISTAVTFESSYGHALSEAYNAGASDKDARRYALISASAEAGSELMFGGIGKGSKAIGISRSAIPLDDKVAKFASDRFKSTFAKNLTQWAIKSGGEGLEEVISGTFSALGKKLTYMKDEDFKKILKDEKLLDQFISGAISAGISSGTGMIKSTKTGQDYISGRTNSEQQIYDRMIENKTNELKASKNNELKQKAIDDKVKEIIEQKKEKFKNAKIDEKAIRAEVENNIDFDDSTIKLSKKELAEINEAVDEAFEKGKLNLNDIYETFTPEETNKIARLEKELQNKNLTEEAKNGYEKELLETIKQRNETLTNESEKNMFLRHTLYNEEQRATNFELTKEEKKLVESDEKLKNLYDDAVKYGNNSEEAHKFVNALAKMSKQTEYQYRLTDTKELNQLGYKVSNKNAVINGLHDGDNKTIYINMDSDNALNVVVGHETGHIFENTQEYKELQEMLFKVAEEDGTLEARRAELKELYKDVKNANIDVELTNDLLGEKLFTDEKFIERLAEKPNLFTKIKDKIDDLVIQFKGTEEEKELRKIQNKFLEVYRKNNLQEYVAEADAKANKKTHGTELSLKLNGYNPEINVKTSETNKFKINDINNLKEVKEKIYNYYANKYISTLKQSKPITNIDTGMKIEIWKNGINETFGNAEYYKNLSLKEKKAKLATMEYLAKMIKYGEVRADSADNYHNSNSPAKYYYLKHPIKVDGNNYIVNIDIRKVPNTTGRFHIHSIDTKKVDFPEKSKTSQLTKSTYENNIPQTQEKIKSDKADYSLSKNKIQGLEDYSKEQIYNLTKDYINTALLYSDIDAEIKGMEIIGSRNRGTAKENSDLDIVVELDGDNLREDDLFNVLNDSEEPLEINGIKVDINPIVNYRSGTLEEFMKRSNQYDQDILKNQKLAPIKTNNLNEYIADVSAREAKQNALDKESVRQSIIDYLEENNITNPTKEDMMNAFDDYDVMDNSDTLNDANKAEKLYSEVADEILKENNSKYSLSTKDNQNRTLSKEQQDYFKDSKVRDENGNLKVLYNGSGNHTTFLPQYMSDESIWGKGIYLTPYKDVAELYGNDIKEVYVDIKNPLTPGKTITFDQYNDLYKAINDGEEAYIEEYNMYDDDLDLLYDITNKGSWADYADEIIKYTGKDGIIIDNPDNEKSDNMVVAFKSNQIKNVDNKKPTDDADIRYSLSTKDNKGRELNEKQQEFFKDSAIRVKTGDFGFPTISEDGQLFEVYHGTNNEFTKFDESYFGSSNDMGWYGPGYYFAFTEGEAKTYGSKVMKAYLNIKKPFFFTEEMQSYDGKDSGDVNYDFGSFMINMKNKFPEIANKETITYSEYNKRTGELENNEITISDLGKKIEEIYNSKNLKLITIDDAGTNKYQYVYQNDLNGSNVPNEIKSLIENNHIYNLRDAEFALENTKFYKETDENLNKLYKYFNETNNDFSRTYIGYPNANKNVMENSRLSEATWYVVNDVYHNLDRHMPEYYMQYMGQSIKDELIRQGYDGVVQSKSGDEIVAFYPNQIKNVDNLNPSKNDDIRYSLSNKDKIASIRGDYQVYSKDIRNNNLAPIREDITKKPASKNVNYSLLEEPAESEVDYSAFDDMLPIKNELERLDVKEEERLRKKREKYQQQIEQAKKVSKQKKSEFRKNYDNFKTLFINENAEVDNLAKESGNKKLTYKADMLNNYVVEAENDINNYQTDYNGKEIGKSVKQLFEPAKNKGLYEAFNDYLINYSNIDRHKQDKGSLRWESTSQDLINQYEKKYPEFKKWGKDVWQYGKNALNTMEQAGLIDSKLKERLTEMYPHYVPFMDNADLNMYIGANDEIVPKKTIKSAKGGMSTTEMLPMEDALTRYAYSYRKSMRQNDLYSEIVKTLRANEIDTGMDVREEATDLQDSLYRDENGNYLKAYIDGDTKVVSISNDLYRALQNDLKNQVKDLEDRLSLITKPLQKATKIKGNLVTSWSPTFIFKNFFKDFQDAMFNSTDTKKFIKNYPSAFNELRKNDTKLVRQFRAMYGSAVGQYTGSDTGAMKQATKTKNPFKKFANANEIIELAPRYAEFKASLENGATIEEAMYNAREVTTNFSRGGTITKAINRNGFNFVNASTQGLSKFIRNFTGQNGAKGFTHALLKAVEFGVAPALFNELVFGSGDDKDEDYDALPDYVKDNYYLFKYGDNKFIRIPKGRALSVFGSGARRTLEYINGEKDAFDGYGTNVWNQIGINNPEESFLFTPIMQAKNNKAWYGGDIVPTRLQDKPAGEQYDEKTDAFSKWLGKTLNISPKKINYVIDQYSGGLGDMALPFITPEAQSEYDNPAGRALAPIRDQFVVNSIDDNKYVSDFYTNNDKLKVQANSEYATDEDALRYKYSNSVSSELSALYKEKRLIQNDSSLSNSEKYKKAQAIKQQINEIAKEGLDNYKKVNVVGNYAEVNDKEYYRNNKGEWTKAKEEDIEEMNKFGLTTNEKNNYYNSKNNISNITSRYKSLSENATDEEKTQLSTLKKNDIINTIKATNISNDAKAYLYSKYYSSADKMNVISTLDISMDKYLDFELQNFTADKNIYGQTIKNSKKTKMINYINNMSGTYGEKIIIYKLNNMSDNSYNQDIVNYINRQNISMEEKRTLLKALGMKVDYAGNVRW